MKNSGVEWIGEIPEDWEVSKIGQLYEERRTKVSDTVYPPLSVTMQGILPQLENAAKSDAHDDRKLVLKGDFAINSRSDRRGSCGISNFNGSVSLINTVLHPKTEMNPIYYNWLFHSFRFSDEYYKNGHGIVDDLWTTSWSEMKKIFIPLPPKSIQQRIASYLDKKCSKIEETIQNQQQVIEKLKAYKQSLITEAVTGKVKIVNGKICGEYESYKDSGVEYLGKIPLDWNIKRLRYIGKCQNGISKGGEFFGSGYPFVSYGDVYNNLILPETVSGLIESTHEEQENYSVKAGDVFFTRTSETIEEVGFTSVCLKTIENATFAGFVIRVRPFTDELIPDYSKYYFSSDAHRRFFVKEMNLVTRASLSQDLLKRLPVLIPSKEKQKEIADYLDKKCTAIDTIIEQKQKLIEKLTEYKKSLIYECVTGKKAI
ncbi:MAG: restriction endonuclease subunit S [Treponema sp.]|nr:restriction endonuclease subunit S [Treponema sp.]